MCKDEQQQNERADQSLALGGFAAFQRICQTEAPVQGQTGRTFKTSFSFVASIMLPLVFSFPVMNAFWPSSWHTGRVRQKYTPNTK